MFAFLETMPWVLGTIVVVFLFVLTTSFGILLVRKLVPRKTLQSHHDVTGFVFTNLGVLYSVLLGFTVVNVQQRFEKTSEITQMEASYLGDLYRDSAVFPDKNREEVRLAIQKFIQTVIEDEWPLMAEGRASDHASLAFKKVWEAYYKMDPVGPRQEAWYSASIDKLNQLVNARLARIMGGEQSLGNEMWAFLILGGVLITTFVSLFGVDNLKTHLLLGSLLSATTAFLLFLIYTLDTAFTGQVRVLPEAMTRVFESFAEL